MIVNYTSSSVNKLRASLNDDARVVIYDRDMFIVQATGLHVGQKKKFFFERRSQKSLKRIELKIIIVDQSLS
jgi:hypothetical protein